jgi:hypothetical protein
MTNVMSHMTCLNNTYGWSYKLPRSELWQAGYKLVCSQTLFIYVCVSLE